MTTNNTSTSSAIHAFSENTKSVFSLTLKGLVLILFTNFLSQYYPHNESRSFLLNYFLFGLNLLICLILGFAFYNNYKETNNLYKKVSNNSEYKGLRNNILLSYSLCFMLAGLFFYNLYSALF